MGQAQRPHSSHSAEVRIRLTVGDREFSVAELGPGFIVVRNPIDLSLAEAELMMSIDGELKRWRVELVDSLSPSGGDTRIRNSRM